MFRLTWRITPIWPSAFFSSVFVQSQRLMNMEMVPLYPSFAAYPTILWFFRLEVVNSTIPHSACTETIWNFLHERNRSAASLVIACSGLLALEDLWPLGWYVQILLKRDQLVMNYGCVWLSGEDMICSHMWYDGLNVANVPLVWSYHMRWPKMMVKAVYNTLH